LRDGCGKETGLAIGSQRAKERGSEGERGRARVRSAEILHKGNAFKL